MTRLKLYTAIYVVLFVSATTQVLVEFAGLSYMVALAVILGLSFFKAVLVAGYYQHLRFDPRPLTYLIAMAFVAAMAFTLAASFSIT